MTKVLKEEHICGFQELGRQRGEWSGRKGQTGYRSVYKRVTLGIRMELKLFNILTVVVETVTSEKNCIELHTHK